MNEHSNPVHPNQVESQKQNTRSEWEAAKREAEAASEQAEGYPVLVQMSYAPRKEKDKARWYNQGWTWLIVAFIVLTAMVFGFIKLSEQMGLMTDAVQSQVEATREQTGVLRSIEAGLGGIQESISSGFNRLAQLMEEAINAFKRA